ncbi:MAG: hypothetical protein P1U46_04860, partial [Patescibacteria group bacterium]|nr:hypothetical protein [Patescibacteria group bacterium]
NLQNLKFVSSILYHFSCKYFIAISSPLSQDFLVEIIFYFKSTERLFYIIFFIICLFISSEFFIFPFSSQSTFIQLYF